MQDLHANGLLHLGLTAQRIACDLETLSVEIGTGLSNLILDESCDQEHVPLWLELSGESLVIPQQITAAEKVFTAAKIRERPEKIDLHHFASLACELFSHESLSEYLRSPKVNARVPEPVQRIIDGCLGFDAARRIGSASELVDALARADLSSSKPTEEDTRVSAIHDVEDTSVGGHSAISAPSSSDLPWTHLGHYDIVSRIGHGGMGDVYKGFERSLNRSVAIKVLPDELAREPEFVRRFYAEASAAAKVVHPNVIPIHYIGEDQGCHFFAMQYIEGDSLAQLLSRRDKLSVAEALNLMEQILAGLGAAHRQGLIHRDIKPGNILLDSQQHRAVLADFGLVKSLQEEQGNTATGVVMGTVDYISPEQGRGRRVDHRSDLYSLGVLLYQMISGRLPFSADSATALIFQHVYERPQPLSDFVDNIPTALLAVIAKLMAKTPDDRYGSCNAVLEDLRAVRSGAPLPSRADSVLESNPDAYAKLADRSRPAETLVIEAPRFDDEPWFIDDLPEVSDPNWWDRARSWFGGVAAQHAPDLIDRLANTQQQVGLAVKEYERRQKKLQELVNEAEDVFAALREQQNAWQAASHSPSDTAFRTAEDLSAAIDAQEQELDSMRLNLAKVSATLETLRSQRDVLNARLIAANGAKRQTPRTNVFAMLRWCGTVCFLFVSFSFLILSYQANFLNRKSQRLQGSNQTIPAHDDEYVNSGGASSGTSTRRTLDNRVRAEKSEQRVAAAADSPVMVSSEYVQDEYGKVRVEFKVWDMRSGGIVKTLPDGHQSYELCMTADGRFLGSVGQPIGQASPDVRIWDLANGKLLQKEPVDTLRDEEVRLTFLRNSPELLFPVGNGPVNLASLNALTSRVTNTKLATQSPALSIAFAAESDLVAVARVRPKNTGGRKSVIELCRISNGQFRQVIPIRTSATAIAISRDAQRLAASQFGQIDVWDLTQEQVIARFEKATSFHSLLRISPSGRYLATSRQGEIDLYDIDSETMTPILANSGTYDLTFGFDDTLILTTEKSLFQFFDPQTGLEQLLPSKPSSPETEVND